MSLPTPHPRHDGEDGFTTFELLIAMVLGVMALGLLMFFVANSQQKNNDVFSRVGAVDDTSTSLKVIQDALRQAYKIAPSPATGTTSSGTLTYQGIVKSGSSYSLHTFLIDCTVAQPGGSLFRCRRTDQTAGTSSTLLGNLVGPTTSFFTVHAPGSVGLPRVDLSATHRTRGEASTVTLRSSVQPRNCQTSTLTAGACAFP